METNRKPNKAQIGQVVAFDNMRTALFSFKLLITYVLHTDIISLTPCKTIAAENDWTEIQKTARKIIYMNYLGQDKYQ